MNIIINSSKFFTVPKRLWFYLDRLTRLKLVFLLIMMIISSLCEMLSIATLIPFLTVISKPERIPSLPLFEYFSKYVNPEDTSELIVIFLGVFCLTIIFSGIVRLLNLKYSCDLSADIGVNLTKKAFIKVLSLPYESHLEINSSDVIATLVTFSNQMVEAINEYLRIASASLISIGLIIIVLLIDWKLSLISISIFLFSYLILAVFIRKKLLLIQNTFESSNRNQVRLLQESLGSIRNIILNKAYEYTINNFKNENLRLRNSNSRLKFITLSPRIYIEVLALLVVSLLSLLIIRLESNINTITLLGSIALTGQKLLPTLQQIYSGFTYISSSYIAIERILNYLDLSDKNIYKRKDESCNFLFKKDIVLKNIHFKYKNNDSIILKNINLRVTKGERIGIIGKTGSGKSTLIDILMGLLSPSSGEFLIDGIRINDKNNIDKLNSWRSCISEVPQEVFLFNQSFAKNIALSDSDKALKMSKIKKAADKAKIADFIEKLPQSYNTCLGERGSKLSGGQRQRVALARAFYKNSKVLFLDEATNALDLKTQEQIINSINVISRDLTIFMVAHRKEALSFCDKIYELRNGNLIEIKNKDVFKNSNSQ